MKTTKIEWTDRTWNPITGCSKFSAGCINCYAERLSYRLCRMGVKKYRNGFSLMLHEKSLHDPYMWKKPCNIFVCSMSDLFHPDVPFDYIDKVMDVIHYTPQHVYQILTKRAERLNDYFTHHPIPPNAWLGITVESAEYNYRIDFLRDLPATVRFLSCEPLLSDLGKPNLDNIDWIIVGGESGPNARPMKEEWVLNINRLAKEKNIAFFFKQWGTWGNDGVKRNKKRNGKMIKGEIIQEYPKHLSFKEYVIEQK
ncbi:MAG: phage Gp37/Gp68 family protein [Prevotella sp.]|nr:phage Gp37/Gp68 family protein [Prevotella sp.]